MANTTINVVVGKQRTIQLSANGTAGIIDTKTPVTLKAIPTIGGATTLDSLTDVQSIDETTGDTLVYNSTTNKWVAQKLDISDITGSLDGGTF
jgi:hypothetical protein